MVDEAELDELLSLWERARAQGRDGTVADLCRGRPDLVPELERRLRALRRMSALARAARQTGASDATEPRPTDDACPTRALSTQPDGPAAAPAAVALPGLPGYDLLGEL